MLDGQDSNMDNTTGGPPQPKPRRNLRKSCHFCRSRKIKCSGDIRCDACRERNIECSYKENEPKGRPKSLPKPPAPVETTANPFTSGTQLIDGFEESLATMVYSSAETCMRHPQDMACPTPAFLCLDRSGRPTRLSPDAISVTAQVFSAWSWLSGHVQGTPMNLTDQKAALFRAHALKDDPELQQSMLAGPSFCKLSYEDVFFAIAQELIEMLALRVGEMGCSRLDQARARYCLKAYFADNSAHMLPPSMLDRLEQLSPPRPGSTSDPETTETLYRCPLREYDSHQMAQLMEVWFSQHPFSFLFSKTLLLRDIRQETYDDILVAAMLGDVEAAQTRNSPQTKGDALYTWAYSRLNATSPEDLRMSTIHAVILLGWHAMCTGEARLAIALLIWADSNLHTVIQSQTDINVVNGVDVGEVESESLCNTRWLLFAIYQWIVMQAGITARDLPLWESPSALPLADISSLALFRLDHASYSISTMHSQKGAYYELWLLSCVVAFTSQIYRLCPRVTAVRSETRTKSDGWYSHVLNRFRGLSDPVEDILLICTQVRHVLGDLIAMFGDNTPCSTNSALELCIAHTISIHLLLPSSYDGSQPHEAATSINTLGAKRVLAAGGIQKLLSDFCCAVGALLKVFAVLKDSGYGGRENMRITMSQRPSTTDNIMFLALDACTRGLKSLWSLSRNGTDTERFVLNEGRDKLQELAKNLHTFSKRLIGVDASRLGMVIEHLEIIICHFLGLEVEDQDSLNTSSRASVSNSTSVRSRSPPPLPPLQHTDVIMHSQEMAQDFPEGVNMDFVTRNTWFELAPMSSNIPITEWSLGFHDTMCDTMEKESVGMAHI